MFKKSADRDPQVLGAASREVCNEFFSLSGQLLGGGSVLGSLVDTEAVVDDVRLSCRREGYSQTQAEGKGVGVHAATGDGRRGAEVATDTRVESASRLDSLPSP